MRKLKNLKRDYWFPRSKAWDRKRRLSKLFDIDISDDLIYDAQVLWGSNTAQPRKTFIIPVK